MGQEVEKNKNNKTEEMVTEQLVNKSISDRSKLTAATFNCRSVCNKTIDIHDYKAEKELDFIGLPETWLKEDDNIVKAA